jgi:hypothetical protein
MLKKISLTVVLVFVFAFQVQAGATAFFGLSYNFGATAADWGVTIKVLTDNEEDKFVAAAGLSYFPYAVQKFGVDVGGGYLFKHGAATLGWDFLHKTPQLSLGYVNTDDDDGSSETTVVTPVGDDSSEGGSEDPPIDFKPGSDV